jgi:hypothetical protein
MSETRVEIGSGQGVIVADTGGTWYIASDAPSDLLAEIAATVSERPAGRLLARRLAALLTSDAADNVPPFGLVADMDDGVLVFLSGAVEAAATGSDGVRTVLSGKSAATWVDRVFAADTSSIVVAPVVADVPTDAQPFELAAGVVPGGWFRRGGSIVRSDADNRAESPAQGVSSTPDTVTKTAEVDINVSEVPAALVLPPPPAGAGPASDAPEVPPDQLSTPSSDGASSEEGAAEDEPFESFSVAPGPPTIREPLPVDGESGQNAAPTTADDEASGQVVEGILCSRQHFNSPNAQYCSICGISMVHQTHNLVRGGRPPLGYLVFDDGATFTLDGQYVLGREPEIDPQIGAGTSRPIVLDDPQMSVSRVHAEVRLVGWDVQLVDRGSTNGTHIWNDADSAWQRLAADEAHIVRPGVRGAVGQRTFIYESPHHR